MNDKTKIPEEDKQGQDAVDVIKVTVNMNHAKAAGNALKAFTDSAGILDAYISMAYILAYMQESLGLDPATSFKNLSSAYTAILVDENLIKEGFKVINETLLEKKIVMPTQH